MKKHWMAVLFTLAAAMAMVGCAGKVKYPNYYTLNLPPAPDPPAQEGARASLAIREFRSPGYLRRGAIVYKPSPEQIGFYEYHRWATDPRELVTNAVADHLRASGNYAQVKMYDGHADVDYVVSGRLEKLEEVDYEGGVKVEVEIYAQMTKIATGETVWSNTVSETGTVAERNVPAVVAEMDRSMDRAIDKLLTPLPAAAVNQTKLSSAKVH
jgi:ABC-type uncharacterized transport system auxiliary subunit